MKAMPHFGQRRSDQVTLIASLFFFGLMHACADSAEPCQMEGAKVGGQVSAEPDQT